MRGVPLAGPDVEAPATIGFTPCSTARHYARYPAVTTGEATDAERVTERHPADLRAGAQVVVEYRRDGVPVVFDHERLRRIRDAGPVPVAVTDEPRAVEALLRASPEGFPVLGTPTAPARPWSRLLDPLRARGAHRPGATDARSPSC